MGDEIKAPEPPERIGRARQETETAMVASASSVPFAGSALGTYFDAAFAKHAAARRERWEDDIHATVEALVAATNHPDPTGVLDDPRFLDAVVTAVRIAEKSSTEAKWAVLQNALFNVGVRPDLNVDKIAIFMRWVDDLTVSHMRALAFYADPLHYVRDILGLDWAVKTLGNLDSVTKQALPELHEDATLMAVVTSDLERMGLLVLPPSGTIMSSQGLQTPRLTERGAEFVAFISGPFDERMAGK